MELRAAAIKRILHKNIFLLRDHLLVSRQCPDLGHVIKSGIQHIRSECCSGGDEWRSRHGCHGAQTDICVADVIDDDAPASAFSLWKRYAESPDTVSAISGNTACTDEHVL